jgi:replication-associated recombination protein RarA
MVVAVRWSLKRTEARSWVERLVANGIDGETARRAVASSAEHPSVKVERSIASRLKKTEMLPSTVQQLAQAIPQAAVDERNGIDPATFFANYYSRNRPLVLRQALRHWPALYKWSRDNSPTTMERAHHHHIEQASRSMVRNQRSDSHDTDDGC